ncbi:FAD-linked oxidoreductase [Pseudomonas sp. GL93]|uniref:D-arabinono-1,4-lactone oxidase n=1 Tax=Pseudomonas sp. GL93 TaxID=2014741 RepID=UPI000E313A06|nr:D-arabinono-1,4-lactone oxidase [Pseudomonas sp. GL93]RFD25136.1 FAD-linked oxidoreductase [Pseudomonas sp. GL93]
MKQVERIGCLNNGLFVMNFSIQWLDSAGQWHTSEWNSGNFENGVYKVSPSLALLGIPADAIGVAPYVSAVAGIQNQGEPLVQPANNGRLAAYEITGTTLSFKVQPLPWKNWAQNIVDTLEIDGQYYFSPTHLAELQDIVRQAGAAGTTVRVSGQRHAQPALVAEDNRIAPTPRRWLIDLACYADLGPNGDKSIVLGTTPNTVTVNTGVREDELDAFLTAHDLMLKTATAGGFFSLGGMTAVDVHGATIRAPIFAETASAFTLMGPDGQVRTIDAQTPAVDGWSPLQFARVSLGALGVVTSVTLDVLPRPWATTLNAGKETKVVCADEPTFISRFKALLTDHDRVESFLNPYTDNFLILWWDVVASPATQVPNLKTSVPNACALAGENVFGAPYLIPFEPIIEPPLIAAQYGNNTTTASAIIDAGFLTIETLFDEAASVYSDLWLTKASRVIFMSYFIELPALDDEGLGKAWQGLDAVKARLQDSADFLVVAPLEFRFVRGGDTALAGTYTQTPDATFVNLDLIGYVPAVAASDYPGRLMHFFADIERAWVALGGMPHTGKMFGFYNPAQPSGTYSEPFNPQFLKDLAQRRSERTAAFNAFRKACDPKGVFHNHFVATLLGDAP